MLKDVKTMSRRCQTEGKNDVKKMLKVCQTDVKRMSIAIDPLSRMIWQLKGTSSGYSGTMSKRCLVRATPNAVRRRDGDDVYSILFIDECNS